MNRATKELNKILLIFVVSGLIMCQALCAQESFEKAYRDLFSKLGLTSQDEIDLEFLDKIIASGSVGPEEYSRIVRILQDSDSLNVVCQALVTLSNLSNIPENVIMEISRLGTSKERLILCDLAFAFGKLAIPKTFPAFFALLEKPYCSGNVIGMLHRYGIESLPGLPYILPSFQLPGGRQSTFPFILNYFMKLPQHCIFVACNGVGIIVPYVPQQLPHNLLAEFAPEPSLPRIRKMLVDMRQPVPLGPSVKTTYENFELPNGKTDMFSGGYECHDCPVSETIREFFGFLKVKVEFRVKMAESFSYKAVNKSFGQMLDDIFSRYQLKGVLEGDCIIIERKDKARE